MWTVLFHRETKHRVKVPKAEWQRFHALDEDAFKELFEILQSQRQYEDGTLA